VAPAAAAGSGSGVRAHFRPLTCPARDAAAVGSWTRQALYHCGPVQSIWVWRANGWKRRGPCACRRS